MRTENEMMDLILSTAREDERVRAVIMNGSRVNPNVKKDCFQDYDIVYIVKDINSFTSNHSWVDKFGETMIMQMPEDMALLPVKNDGRFAYLMQFTDGNRIDLGLIPVERTDELLERDSLSVLLVDKDNAIKEFPPANDTDYIIQQPSAKQFSDCCNEFWWVSAYVAKGLWRDELPYAKTMFDRPLRDMLMQIIQWYVGIKTNFSKSAGKFGKYLKSYLDSNEWAEFVATYPDANYENIWESLFIACDFFRKIALKVSEHFGFEYPYEDDKRVSEHLKHVKLLPKNSKSMY